MMNPRLFSKLCAAIAIILLVGCNYKVELTASVTPVPTHIDVAYDDNPDNIVIYGDTSSPPFASNTCPGVFRHALAIWGDGLMFLVDYYNIPTGGEAPQLTGQLNSAQIHSLLLMFYGAWTPVPAALAIFYRVGAHLKAQTIERESGGFPAPFDDMVNQIRPYLRPLTSQDLGNARLAHVVLSLHSCDVGP